MSRAEFSISVGGSILIPESTIRTPYIRQFTALLKNRIDDTRQQTAIITGGGGPTRTYQQALRELGVTDRDALDSMGIHLTHINAQLLTHALRLGGIKAQYLSTLDDPVDKQADTWITGGTRPGQTTDAVLVEWSRELGIQTLINATNTPYVYELTGDGQLDKTRPITDMTWKQYSALLGNRDHVPGENLPFGFTASKKAAALGLSVVVLNGNDLENLRLLFERKPFRGTIIHPDHL